MNLNAMLSHMCIYLARCEKLIQYTSKFLSLILDENIYKNLTIKDYVHTLIQRLKQKCCNLHIHLEWVPGHMEIEGNELADEHAKRAAAGDTSRMGDLLLEYGPHVVHTCVHTLSTGRQTRVHSTIHFVPQPLIDSIYSDSQN